MKTKERLLGKRIVVFAIIILLALFGVIMALLKQQPKQAIIETPEQEVKNPLQDLSEIIPNEKPLVLYFSRAENIIDGKTYYNTLGNDIDAMTSASVLVTDTGELTGNVGLLARWIAKEADADLYSIKVKNLYPQSKTGQ